MVRQGTTLWLVCSMVLGCNVSNNSSQSGGASVGNDVCPDSLAVIDSDYTSTNVSLVGVDGSVLSESVLSSGSAPAGLTTALSGDVVLPLTRPASGQLVVIDRYPNSVLTWLDPKTAHVLAQLSVATGFISNPHDYLEVSGTKAYVTRYETNPAPGAKPFDGGGDLLVLDIGSKTIRGHVALGSSTDGNFLPRPDRMIPVGDEVWVVLQRANADLSATADSRLVGVDPKTDTVTWKLDLPSAADCSGFARSPSGDRVALACSGAFSDADPKSRSTIILLDATAHPPVEVRRFEAQTDLNAQLGPSIAFARDDLLLGTAYGDGKTTNDRAFTVDVSTAKVTALLDAGAAFALGDVFCDPGCSDSCWLADARAGAVRHFEVSASALTEKAKITPDPSVGLPPRGLGFL